MRKNVGGEQERRELHHLVKILLPHGGTPRFHPHCLNQNITNYKHILSSLPTNSAFLGISPSPAGIFAVHRLERAK
jgi:hypothetical protein